MRHLRLGRRVALLVPLALLFGVVFTTGSSRGVGTGIEAGYVHV